MPNNRSVISQLRELLPTDRETSLGEAKVIAERQAFRLLKLLEIAEPSVDVARIAELPRVRVRVASQLPVSGLTYWNNDSWDISVRREDSSTRRRFTLAHEFKHIIDHPYIDVLYPGLDRDEQTAKQVEAICDHFAACFLMPGLWIKREWLKGNQGAKRLAHTFNVSPTAMAIRLTTLGLIGPAKPVLSQDGDVRKYFRTPPNTVPAPADVPVPPNQNPLFTAFLSCD